MMKRKKDGGFTLIELMIVIAVIGILAVVMVPKMSSVKDSAKATGVITNAKSVEAYVVANIDKWDRQVAKGELLLGETSGGKTGIVTLINNLFENGGSDALSNPFGGDAIDVSGDPSPDSGIVTVTIPTTLTNGITINGYDKSETDKVYTSKITLN